MTPADRRSGSRYLSEESAAKRLKIVGMRCRQISERARSRQRESEDSCRGETIGHRMPARRENLSSCR